MSEETIGGLIMLGLWVAFMAVIIIINKRRKAKGIAVESFKPSQPTGLNIPMGTLDARSVPWIDEHGKDRYDY